MIYSKGHRNIQGLYSDNNVIIATEHGPRGGDEINNIIKNKNYGWPISSYGEHYKKNSPVTKNKYDKYPLYKSHNEHGYLEPLIYFVPSIGISEIVGIGDDKYILTSLRENSFYFLKMNNLNEIEILKKYPVGERIRDVIFKNEKLFFYLENTASIGIVDLKQTSIFD